MKVALVGVGKIARDRHVPAIENDPAFTLAATADPCGGIDGVPAFATLDDLLRAGPTLDAVAICTPPQGRAALAAKALGAGLHVLLEKPPAATLGEVALLREAAAAAGRTLFAAWHSRAAGAVEPARAWLASRRVSGIRIDWKEDIRRWHPGQDWILDAGGFGVFDPAINALSIATAILPGRLLVTQADLAIPNDRQSPIAAEVGLACGDADGRMSLDFLERDAPCWTIVVECDDGVLRLDDGGRVLLLDGQRRSYPNEEYPRLYRRFAGLIDDGRSDLDDEPSRLVADALAIGRRRSTATFSW
ncbi:MAG: Gfo/Idh/MocA family oxidoreductase [Sphingomonas adhaesiva]|uniref:Gfo/Idh/MocA family protein n=1 Tax=Sphingomonas adhaesiva TaxID=28212 RepID=UPI002FF688A4